MNSLWLSNNKLINNNSLLFANKTIPGGSYEYTSEIYFSSNGGNSINISNLSLSKNTKYKKLFPHKIRINSVSGIVEKD